MKYFFKALWNSVRPVIVFILLLVTGITALGGLIWLFQAYEVVMVIITVSILGLILVSMYLVKVYKEGEKLKQQDVLKQRSKERKLKELLNPTIKPTVDDPFGLRNPSSMKRAFPSLALQPPREQMVIQVMNLTGVSRTEAENLVTSRNIKLTL